MMTSCQVDFEPLGIRAECPADTALSEVARSAGVGLESVCGGRGVCGRCQVRIVTGAVSPPAETERQHLSAAQLADGYRLACLTRVLGDVKVDVPATSCLMAQRLQLTGVESSVPFEPAVEEYRLALNPASLNDLRPDQARLIGCLESVHGRPTVSIDLMALRQLSPILRENEWQARVAVRDQEVVDVRSPYQGPLGLAIDLGTTKVAAYLVDMETGQTVAADGAMNHQIAYGEDVMSRIACAMQGKGEMLRRAITEGINDLIERLCPESERIVEVSLVGNTAMHHLFLGLPVQQLGRAPYLPAVSAPLDVKARDLGLHVAPGAYVHLLPNVAGFIGSDHVAMILATGIDRTEKTVLGLDIGTNTEVVLARHGELMSCSTASGPAFEGAHIKHGMRAASGAIEKVRLNDSEVEVQTIDDAPAIGLCGSGVLDAISELHRVGLLNRRGRLHDGPGVRCIDGKREFVLVSGEHSGGGHGITLTERDVGEIQLAKAAIRTGLEALLREMGLRCEEVDEVIIAGAFGTYINVASAVAIGMLPPLPLERFQQVGNAAGVGSKLALVSRSHRAMAMEISRRVRYLELMTQPDFASQFARAMYLQP
ncbi:MAG: ASKHA domain-containing protein [Chloroflexota bacterium]|nr:ASKHA domain-containing protein [Chloroflexota bacterium]